MKTEKLDHIVDLYKDYIYKVAECRYHKTSLMPQLGHKS